VCDAIRVRRECGAETDPVFVSNRDQRLSRDAVEQIVGKHAKMASAKCPSLKKKRVRPYVLRHSAAMQLLQNGVDHTDIALRLGHESVETTRIISTPISS
jgi:site-specific recombinase XerD